MSPGSEPSPRVARQRSKPGASDFDLALGAKIRSARLAADVTLTALGQAIGVTFQQVHRYEYGEVRVSAAVLQRIADALGHHPGIFFDGCADAGQVAPPPKGQSAAAKRAPCYPA